MFDRNDLRALIITIVLIALGYLSMYAFIHLGEYLNILVE